MDNSQFSTLKSEHERNMNRLRQLHAEYLASIYPEIRQRLFEQLNRGSAMVLKRFEENLDRLKEGR